MAEAIDRSEWDRMRILGSIFISPHTKKAIPPKNYFRCPGMHKPHTRVKSIRS